MDKYLFFYMAMLTSYSNQSADLQHKSIDWLQQEKNIGMKKANNNNKLTCLALPLKISKTTP